MPGSGGPIEQTHDFDLVDATGAVLEELRSRNTRPAHKDAWHLTGHVVEGDALIEIVFRIRVPEYHGGAQERTALERATLLAGLVPHRGRRWKTPTGHHLLEAAPQGTTYGANPPCDLLDGLHDYTLVDPATDAVVQRFHRSDVLVGNRDDEVLTRHRVEDDELVEYVFDYYEDSCWGTSNLRGHERSVRIAGLVPLPEEP